MTEQVKHAAKPGAGRGLARFITTLTAALVAAVILLGVLTFLLLQQYLAALRGAEQVHRTQVVRQMVEQRLAFYHDLLHGYARDRAVRDLIIFGDPGEAAAWSARVRDTLPQAIGAALFTADGQVLGEAASQRVGEQCVIDLRRRLRDGRDDLLLPVHDSIPALAHFDVTAPVRDETGQLLGLIFVSFTVNELPALLDRVSTDDEAAALVDRHSGKPIATSRNWAALAGNELTMQDVAGSGWQLQVRLAPSTLTPALPVVGGVIGGGMLLVITVMLLAGRFLTRRYAGEMAELQGLLGSILAGDDLDDESLQRAEDFFPGSGALRSALAELGDRHQDLQRDSHQDELTGLANRRAFYGRLEDLLAAARRGGDGFALVLLDLDGLKALNDRYGHVAGDQALQAFGRALLASVRGSDLASRWGGDEFAALLSGMAPDRLEAWLERLRDTFAAQQRDAEQLHEDARCQVSAGYLWISPGDKRDATMLVAEADARLYRDKVERRSPR